MKPEPGQWTDPTSWAAHAVEEELNVRVDSLLVLDPEISITLIEQRDRVSVVFIVKPTGRKRAGQLSSDVLVAPHFRRSKFRTRYR